MLHDHMIIYKFRSFDHIFLCFDDHKMLLNFLSNFEFPSFHNDDFKTNEPLKHMNLNTFDPPFLTLAPTCFVFRINFLPRFLVLIWVTFALKKVLDWMDILKNKLAQKQNTLIYFMYLHH